MLVMLAFFLTGNTITYRVTGTIVNINEMPVAGQEVLLLDYIDQLMASDMTDENGFFTLLYEVETVSAEPGSDIQAPESFKLGASYPNPFNPRTTFPFEAPENTIADISVFNILGQKVIQSRKEVSRGSNEIVVNLGGNMSQGTYLLRIQGDGFSQTQPMTFVSAGIGSGNPGISLRSGANAQVSTRQSLLQIDSETFRIVVEETDAFLRNDILVPSLRDVDVGIIELVFKEFPLEVTIEGEGLVEKEEVFLKNYEFGTMLQLTAVPSEGWEFSEWAGDLKGTENPQILSIENPKEVTAFFLPLPAEVVTIEATDILDNSATILAEVVDEGGMPVTERGVCFASAEDADHDESCIPDTETGTGPFSVSLTGLESETSYSARAYAISSVDTVFGSPVTFQTISPFEAYIAQIYPDFRYELVSTTSGSGYTAFILRMYSQEWLNESVVDETEWWHWVTIVVPDQLQHTTGMLVIDAGSRTTGQPRSVNSELVLFAVESQSVIVEVHNVPFQPIVFATDEGPRQLREDALIAYGWRVFLEDGARDEDVEWLAQLPMTVASMRAMDATTEFLEQNQRMTVDSYVVTGASKRGWAAWLTAALDDRVVAVAPLVIDMLNFEESLEHHWRSLGDWSPAIDDYVNEGIMDWTGTPELERLSYHVDPYTYLDRLDMPKYIVNAGSDEYFLPDSWQFYWDDLQGDKWIRYIPNSGHGVLNMNTFSSLLAFYNRILNDLPVPDLGWEVVDGGFEISFEPGQAPDAITLWRADNPNARDFRLPVIGQTWTSVDIALPDNGTLFIPISAPDDGFSAWLVEAIYGEDDAYPFVVTSGVVIQPDVYPFPPFVPNRP